MKSTLKTFAKINVLGCEERIDRNSGRQELDKLNQPLWNADVQIVVLNEKYNIPENQVVKVKSLESLTPGEHYVELRVSAMGEGNGSFVKVNQFYRVERTFEAKTTIKDLFTDIGVANLSSKATTAKPATASMQ